MNSLFETLRRYIGTLSLSLLIAAGVAYYVLAYVPQQTANLNGRYFRVLERIGLNVQHKIEAQFKVQEGLAWRMQQLPTPLSEEAVRRNWVRVNRETPNLTFEALRTGRTTQLPRARLDSLGRVLFYQPLLPGRAQGLELVCSLSLDSLVRPLRRPDVFDYFVVFEPTTKRLLFSNNAGMLAGGAEGKGPAWLRDSTGLWAGKTTEFMMQGQLYHLFAQPLRLVPGTDWLLCGAVPAAQFDAERHSISAATLEAALSLLLLGILALPFLKLAFMSAYERLNRPDVFLCAASLVLGSGLVTLGIQSFVMRHWLERDLLEHQLTQLNRQVQRNLLQELQALRTTASTADTALQAQYGSAPLAAGRLLRPLVLNELKPAPFSWQPQQPDSSDLLLWIDADGRGRVALSPERRHSPDYIAGLQRRRYFRAAQRLRPAARPADQPYYFESIISYKDTRTIAAIAQPSTWRNLRTAASGAPGVCLLSTDLQCLAQPILPPGYSFCLIDERGEVLFHSDARLRLSENLLDDAEPSPELRAAIFAQDKTFAEGNYQGRHCLLYLQPVAGTAGRYLVTIADLGYVQDWQLQTLSEAAGLLAAFWGLLALVTGVVLAARPHSRMLLAVRHSFPHLWPRRDYSRSYLRIVVAHVLGLGLLTGTATAVNPLAQLLLLLLLPLYLYSLTFRQLRLNTEKIRPTSTWRQTLVLAAVVVVLNLIFGRWIGWAQLWPVLLFQVALLLLVLAIGSPRLRLPTRYRLLRWRPSYRQYYAAMLLSWIMVLSIVPSMYCYQIADGVERMYQVRYTHLSLLQQLRQPRLPANDQELSRLQQSLASQWAFFTTGQAAFLPPYRPGAHSYPDSYRAYQTRLPAFHYYSFFFNTRLSPTPLGTAPGSPTNWLTRNYAILMSRKFYGVVHHSFATNAASTKQALPTTATDTTELARWGVARPSAVTLYASQTDNRSWLRSQTRPLFGVGPQWFNGPATEYASPWFNPLWVLPLLLVLLVYLLYRLVRYAVRWTFSPIVLTHRDLALPLHPDGKPYPGQVHQFLLTPAASTLDDLPEQEKEALTRLNPARLDCRQLPALDALDRWLSASFSYPAGTVVLEHFEYAPQEAEQTERKRAAVEWLIRKNKHVVILSRLHPAAFADCGHALERECSVSGHSRIREAGTALMGTLAYFRADYLPLQPYHSPLQPSDFLREWAPWQERLLKRECASLPFLQRLYQPLQQVMQQRWQLGQRLDPDNIVLAVQRMAQFHYRSLWRILSPQEQFFLYDMAHDGLVNPRSVAVMDTLLQKGFLKIDAHGRLRLVNDSFRSFVLSSVRQQQALRFEREGTTESTWAALHLPLLLILTSGALFIFVTQRAVMTQAQQFLTAFVSLLPLLGRLLAGFSLFGGSTDKPDPKM